jgi:hypothetical protein
MTEVKPAITRLDPLSVVLETAVWRGVRRGGPAVPLRDAPPEEKWDTGIDVLTGRRLLCLISGLVTSRKHADPVWLSAKATMQGSANSGHQLSWCDTEH